MQGKKENPCGLDTTLLEQEARRMGVIAGVTGGGSKLLMFECACRCIRLSSIRPT